MESVLRFPGKEKRTLLEGMSYVDVGLTLDVSHQEGQKIGLGLVQSDSFLGARHVDGLSWKGFCGGVSQLARPGAYFGRKVCSVIVNDEGPEDGGWWIKLGLAEKVYGWWDMEWANACWRWRWCCSGTRRCKRLTTMIVKEFGDDINLLDRFEVCKECDTMVYRNGEDHQLPVEGNGCFSR